MKGGKLYRAYAVEASVGVGRTVRSCSCCLRRRRVEEASPSEIVVAVDIPNPARQRTVTMTKSHVDDMVVVRLQWPLGTVCLYGRNAWSKKQ